MSCGLPIRNVWGGSHVREATANGLAPTYCRTEARSRFVMTLFVIALAVAVGWLGWFVGRRRRPTPRDQVPVTP
jgi:hypothetical protein